MKSSELVIQEIEDLCDEFSYIETPIEKMQFIIDIGKEGSNNLEIATHSNEIPGCVSNAYLDISHENGILHLSYCADAIIIQGFLAMICELLEDTSFDDLSNNLKLIKEFSKTVGLESFLSPNRANALHNIFQKIESIL